MLEARLKQLKSYLKQPGFKGVMLDRSTIEEIVRTLDPQWKPETSKLPAEI